MKMFPPVHSNMEILGIFSFSIVAAVAGETEDVALVSCEHRHGKLSDSAVLLAAREQVPLLTTCLHMCYAQAECSALQHNVSIVHNNS